MELDSLVHEEECACCTGRARWQEASATETTSRKCGRPTRMCCDVSSAGMSKRFQFKSSITAAAVRPFLPVLLSILTHVTPAGGENEFRNTIE